jgi:hypothetical protein
MPAATGNFDPLPLLTATQVPQGAPFAGAVVQAPAGKIDWYFANTGLRWMVHRAPQLVYAHILAYANNVDPDGSIRDVVFPAGDFTKPASERPASDSDDACAASFVSLVSEYLIQHGSNMLRSTFAVDLATLISNNMDSNRFPNGMIKRYKNAHTPASGNTVALLMDNCECCRAFYDLSRYFQLHGNADLAAQYAALAAKTLKALEGFYDSTINAWRWAYDPSVPNYPIGNKFYADGVAQVWPDLMGLPTPGQWKVNGYTNLNAIAPNWPGQKVDDFPWVSLIVEAIQQGDFDRAKSHLNYVNTCAAQNANRPYMTVLELGWYQYAIDLMGLWPI